MQRILKRAGQVSGFVRGEITGDDRLAVRDLALDHRRRNDLAVEHDRQPIIDVVPGYLAENVCALTGEFQSDLVATLFECCIRPRNLVAGKLRATLNEKFLLLTFVFLGRVQDHVPGRRKGGSGCDLGNQLITAGMDQAEFEFGDALKLLPGGLDLGRVQAGNLHQDPVGSLFGDHGLANPELVNALANNLDGLPLHLRRDLSRAAIFAGARREPEQKGGAALEVEPEVNLLIEGQKRIDRECAQEQGQSRA